MRSVLAKLIAFTFGLTLVAASGASAAELAAPADRPILSMSGNVTVTNDGEVARFDRAMLEAIGTRSFTTKTPWYEEPVTFEGVPMTDLLKAVGAQGEKLVVYALNDYSAEIPTEDLAAHGVILALKRDGEYMSVRDKGPLFIVYPYDSKAELQHQQFYSRSVWQVARIEVK